MNELLSTEIYAGRTLGDFLSLQFLASVLGDVLAAIVIIVLGILMALPIPFVGNIPPAIAVCTLCLATIDRSPRLWFIGMGLSVVAIGLAIGFGYGLLQVGTAVVAS